MRLVLLRGRWALDAEAAQWEVCLLGGGDDDDPQLINALPYKDAQLVLLQAAAARGGGGAAAALTVTSYEERTFTEVSMPVREPLMMTLREMLRAGQLQLQPLLEDEVTAVTAATVVTVVAAM